MKAFLKKEWMEWSRTGRMFLLLIIFILFGIMNPALAKLTPWLMEALSDSLADTGLQTTAVTVDAMTSWAQFYKNIPMALLVFVLLSSGSFTGEYQQGTLVPVVAKGLSRRKILAAKAMFLLGAWTVLYLMCFGITYGYNAYFWDNAIAKNLLFAGACNWLFGIWVIALLIFFSTVAKNSPQVMLGTGSAAMGAYLLHMFPRFSSVLPVKLTEGLTLLQGVQDLEDFYAAMASASAMAVLCITAASLSFDKKRL